MPERPPAKIPSVNQILQREAADRFENFAQTFEPAINAYFGVRDIQFTCKPGGWYIDLEKIIVNADPKFFIERGYTESEALFATFHEAEHFRDMITAPEVYKTIFAHFKIKTDVHKAYPKALQRLYNCVDDVLVNNAVMTRWNFGKQVKDRLYPKLFPSRVLNFAGNPPKHQPRHRQFMYALLREAMLPDEKCEVDADVRQALDSWQKRLGKNINTLEFLTYIDPATQSARHTPEKRYDFMRHSLEPIFEELYKKDLADLNQFEEEGEGEGKGAGQKGEGDPFEGDPFDDAIPDRMDPDELFDQAQKINKAIGEKKADEFKDLMGVDRKDFEAYQKDYKKVEAYIDELSHAFDPVINRRKSYRRKLRRRTKEGPMIDSRLVATGFAAIKTGHTDPTIMLDYEQVEKVRNSPRGLDLTLICDGSGSVKDPISMSLERQLAVLAMEAFNRFRERIALERQKGEQIILDIKTETRIFSDGDTCVQPLSNEFNHKDRIRLHKQLLNMPGGGTNEVPTLEEIKKQFDAKVQAALRKGELKKIVIFLTDGESNNAEALKQKIKELYALAGKTKEGKSNLVVAAIGFDQGNEVVKNYAPFGYYAASLDKVIPIFVKIIEQILEDI